MTVTALGDPEDDLGNLHIVILEDGLPSNLAEGALGHTVVELREHDPVTVSFAQVSGDSENCPMSSWSYGSVLSVA